MPYKKSSRIGELGGWADGLHSCMAALRDARSSRPGRLSHTCALPRGRWEELLASPALRGYTGLLQERRGGDSPIANAMLWRPSRLSLLWQDSRSRALLASFLLTDALGQQQVSPGRRLTAQPARRAPAQPSYDPLHARLAQVLFVANLHLEGSPYRPNDRVSQTRSALQVRRGGEPAAHPATHVPQTPPPPAQVRAAYPCPPWPSPQRLEAQVAAAGLRPSEAHVLVVGDFNSGPHEAVCSFLYRCSARRRRSASGSRLARTLAQRSATRIRSCPAFQTRVRKVT